MNLNRGEKTTALTLEKLVYASSDDYYDDLYLEFNMCLQPLREYFQLNWHNIREFRHYNKQQARVGQWKIETNTTKTSQARLNRT